MDDMVRWLGLVVILGSAAWVYVDARRTGRAPLTNALACVLLPGIGHAAYLGARSAERRLNETMSNSAELAEEVSRLRAEVEALRGERSSRPA